MNAVKHFLVPLMLLASAGEASDGVCSRELTQYRMQAWTTDDGLPLDTVLALAQTKDGFVWIGTESGLARFDGSNFTRIDVTASGDGVSDWIESLSVLGGDRLLAGTGSGGLLVIDDAVSAPRRLFDWPHKISTLATTGDGRIWFGPLGGGLMLMETLDAEAVAVESGAPGRTVTAIAPRRAGGVWVGYPGKGIRWSDGGQLNTIEAAEDISGAHVEALLEARDGTLWIAAREGLYSLSGGELQKHEAMRNFATALVHDQDGSLWVGTSGDGLLRRCGSGVQRMTEAQGLLLELVQDLMLDADGDIWVATSGGGVAHFSIGAALPITARQGLPDRPILPLIEDAAGTMWVGTFGGGIAWLDDAAVEIFDEADGLASNWVFSFANAPDGSMWVGSRGGASRFSGRRPVRTLTVDDGLPANAVVSLLHDGDKLWIGTIEGLASFDGAVVKRYAPEGGGFGAHIISLHASQDGALWIGTNGNGIFRLQDGLVSRPDFHSRLQGSLVLDFHERPDGVLWIATNRGLMRRAADRIDLLDESDGLPDSIISSMLDDGRGSMWMSGNHGVYRVRQAELEAVALGERERIQAQRFRQSDGMPMTETNGAFEPSAWRDREGRLWYPTTRGIAVFNPDSIPSAPEANTVRLLKISVQGRQHPETDRVVTEPRPAAVSFEFAAPEFRHPDRVEYRYRLLGLDDVWYAADTGTALYHRPPPGSHRFEVQARIAPGPWSETTSVAVTIRAHLLQTVWFWLTAAMLLAAGGGFVLHRRASSRARRQAHLQEVQKLEAIGLLAGGIAHDFNNVLGAIMSTAELLTERLPRGSTEREDAEAVFTAAEKGAALTRQLLTFSGRHAGTLTWLDLAVELRAMEDFLRRLLTASVELVLDIDDCGEALIDKIQLQQILLNLVTNARDAMPDGGRITIELKAHASPGQVRLTVRDTGTGIDEATRSRIFEPFFTTKRVGKGTGLGLAVTHGIVDGAGGRIDIESGRGAGTAFHVVLPVRDIGSSNTSSGQTGR